jgi:hypothetical protein
MGTEYFIHNGKNVYIHQESSLRSSHIAPQLKIVFELKAISTQRNP